MIYLMKIWLPVFGLIAIGLMVWLIWAWPVMEVTQRLSILVSITLILHVLEEERFPDGFGYMFNVVRGNSDAPDRYP